MQCIQLFLAALATLGKGRVAAFTNNKHVENLGGSESNGQIRLLHDNLLTWLKDGDTGTWEICMPTKSSQLSTCLNDKDVRTLVWARGIWPTDDDNDDVTSWVREGNTLVHGFSQKEFESETVESAKHIGFYPTLLEAGIAYEGEDASHTVKPVTDLDVELLVNQNLETVAESLGWSKFETNARFNYVLDLVEKNPRYFLAEISNHVLSPFESFAEKMEKNMIWPTASPDDHKDFVITTDKHDAMYRVYYIMGTAHLWKAKAPNVHLFPGDVPNPPATESASFSFQSQELKHFFTTGYYLVAGEMMTLEITNTATDHTWKDFEVYVGMYKDNLTGKRSEIARFPKIVRIVELVDRIMTVRSPHGGLVYIQGPASLGRTLDITISGVIPTPYLDITSDKDWNPTWERRCESAGLAADIRGYHTRFTLPVAGGVCTLKGKHIKDVVKLWDEAVHKSYELRGDPDKIRQQSLTSDIQTSSGALHSGYPIVGKFEYGYITNDLFYLSGDWSAMWGPYHELGHNHSYRKWVYSQVTETVCNIFALLQHYRMAGYNWSTCPKIQDALQSNKLKNWLSDPSWTSDHYNNWVRFLVYGQMIENFGWACQRDVFKSYLDDKDAGNWLPVGDEEIIIEWVKRWSLKVHYNLCPTFRDFWKWPVDSATCRELEDLTPYLPDDEITQRDEAADLTASVVAAYPDLVREVTVTPSCGNFDLDPI